MMMIYLVLNVPGVQKEGTRIVHGEEIKFNYPAIFDDRYIYRGEVDNHNALRSYGGTKSQNGLYMHVLT